MFLSLVLVATASAACPRTPSFRDGDGDVVILAQNLKFIATGGQRDARATILANYLKSEGAAVDLLLLSEARDADTIEEHVGEWCFYSQAGNGLDGYRWDPAGSAGRSPGGLVLGVRQRSEGLQRGIAGSAGRVYRARPVSLAEGLLGPLVGFVKGWAGLDIDGTRIVWTHTQASYDAHPERGAGNAAKGRAGQFHDLAGDLGRSSQPTLVTGDLNVLDDTPVPKARIAAGIDGKTLADFVASTGIHFAPPRAACADGTFVGTLAPDGRGGKLAGAALDRVGVNDAFNARHPGMTVGCADISSPKLRLSDHRGLLIDVPFDKR